MTTQRQETHDSVDAEIVDIQEVGLDRVPLLEVIERCLEKGLVIDAWASMRLLGIEVVAFDVHMHVASFDTYLKYLRYAEAIERTALVSIPPP